MPSHSVAQHNLMEAVLHSTNVSRKTGIPKGVALDFVKEDSQGKGPPSTGPRTKSAALLQKCAWNILQ
jgi:transposase